MGALRPPVADADRRPALSGAERVGPRPAQDRIIFRSVTKTFEGTNALDGVSFSVKGGQIHALLGANGAGKSTLIKLLAGLHSADSGQIDVADNPPGSKRGVSFIHQDLALVPDLTVAENIALTLGFPRGRFRAIDWAAVREQARRTLRVVGGGVDVDTKVEQLSRADQSIVAIARALVTDSAAIVLDEPTASLPDRDVNRLFDILGQLRQSGVSVLYVTHRLDEVRRIADWVTVLRDGKVAVDCSITGISDEEIVTAIVGGAVAPHVRTDHRDDPLSPALALHDARVEAHTTKFSLHIHPGEILGLAGLRGSGQERVGRALAGIVPLHDGRAEKQGETVSLRTVQAALGLGIGFATSRREQEALGMTLTVRENLFFNPAPLGKPREVFTRPRREKQQAMALVREVALRPPDPERIVATLSGGNQQKVVLGRWLHADLSILVLEEPTMGIDVGARAEIYGLMQDLATNGLAIVVVSSDFDELAQLCHRALIFDRGSVAGELTGDDVRREDMILLATGGVNDNLDN
jgi:ribose transport system ATP-binding protein